MKNKIFYAIAIAVALFTGYSAYNAHNQQELSDVLLANVEALTGDESSSSNEVIPDYYNYTDKNPYKELKTELGTDSAGIQITIKYSRTCTTYYTYCKATSKKNKKCYVSQNKMVTDCGSWSKE